MTSYAIEKACKGGRDIVRKPKKRDPRKTAINKADKAFADYIKARDGRCVTCDLNLPLDCSHVFRRGHYSTRWDEVNAYAQCRRCHMIHHGQTESYLHDYARAHMGKANYEALRDEWNKVTKWTMEEILGFADYYTEKLRRLEK
jgi:hypothetical protein